MTLSGKVTKLEGRTLTLTNGPGRDFALEVALNAAVTINGLPVPLEALQPNDSAFCTMTADAPATAVHAHRA